MCTRCAHRQGVGRGPIRHHRNPGGGMAHLYRLILVLALLCCSSAFASFAPTDGYDSSQCNETKYPWPYGSDPKVSNIRWVCGYQGRAPTDCGWAYFSGYVNKDVYTGMCNMGAPVKSCPSGSTMSADGKSCTCNPGLLESFGSCVESRDPESQCGHIAAIWNSTLTPDRTGRAPGRLSSYADGATVCHDSSSDSGGGGGLPAGKGCKHKFTGDMSFQDDKGSWWTKATLNKPS